MYDALSAIDLMKPQRSTLKDKLWPYDSSLSLDQMKEDLETLNWQECPVQSIETISQLESSGGSDVVSKSLPMSSFEISRKRRRSKRMRNIADNGTAARCNIPPVLTWLAPMVLVQEQLSMIPPCLWISTAGISEE
ncbi:uncharacterized protein LOC131179509 [Hevea brasiliensis]|nr:uncharacterized protein LOC131179509 [Hevea brasiliensis]